MSLDEKTNLHSWLSQIAHANVQFPAARSLLSTLKKKNGCYGSDDDNNFQNDNDSDDDDSNDRHNNNDADDDWDKDFDYHNYD